MQGVENTKLLHQQLKWWASQIMLVGVVQKAFRLKEGLVAERFRKALFKSAALRIKRSLRRIIYVKN